MGRQKIIIALIFVFSLLFVQINNALASAQAISVGAQHADELFGGHMHDIEKKVTANGENVLTLSLGFIALVVARRKTRSLVD